MRDHGLKKKECPVEWFLNQRAGVTDKGRDVYYREMVGLDFDEVEPSISRIHTTLDSSENELAQFHRDMQRIQAESLISGKPVARRDALRMKDRLEDLQRKIDSDQTRADMDLCAVMKASDKLLSRNFLFHTMYAVNEWRSIGEPDFVVEPQLTELLAATDFDVPTSMIQLPFPTTLIRWPGAVCPAVLVTEYKEIPDWLSDLDSFDDANVDRLITAILIVPGQKPLQHIILLSKDMETIASTTVDQQNCELAYEAGLNRDAEINKLVNTLLYISHGGAVTHKIAHPKIKSKKPAKQRQQIRDYIYLKARHSQYTEANKGTGSSLRSRVRVRGHWRNQACGLKHRERKLIWILPHWKGPEDGDVSHKQYRVT